MAYLAIFSTDMLWESCFKFNFEQLSHSMCLANILILIVKREKNMKMTVLSYFSTVMANLAIFCTDMLWESCLKFNFEQLFHSMCVTNIAILLILGKNIMKIAILGHFSWKL